MSLFSSIQLATNTLRTAQIGLAVVGQNLANANTPGYIREDAVFTPAPVQRLGGVVIGLGVQVAGVVQKVDTFVLERLITATGDRAGAEVQEQAYRQLEGIVAELTDTDLSTSLSEFVASIAEVLNQPESVAVRNLAVLRGQTLSSNVNLIEDRVQSLRRDLNQRTGALAEEINTLTDTIARLNVRITTAEGGGALGSDAGALRDQRNTALGRLAEIIDVKSHEQQSGGVNINIGGEFLVFEDRARRVSLEETTDRGSTIHTLQFEDAQSDLDVNGGELAGLYEARDGIVGGFLDRLDDFASTLTFEFNKLYSRGQGLSAYESVTAESSVNDADAPLDAAGLNFTPTSGSFDLIVRNNNTGVNTTHNIVINLDGLDEDTSLNNVAEAINAIVGVSATVSSTGELNIANDSPELDFTFASDDSGLLASLGINTFFSGTNASSLGVSSVVRNDASKFAASLGGIGEDADNAVRLAQFLDEPLDSQGGISISAFYDQTVNEVAQGSTVSTAVADGFRVFEATLEGEHQAITGVSFDEEAVKMISLQRLYQASARYIRELSELLDTLISL